MSSRRNTGTAPINQSTGRSGIRSEPVKMLAPLPISALQLPHVHININPKTATKARRYRRPWIMEIPEPDIITYAWYPRGVTSVIASGSSNFIGLVDENTVLKYPDIPPENPQGLNLEQEKIYRILRQQQRASLDVEEKILRVLGEHRRIISFKGKHEDGLLLEYMPNGSLADYLPNADPQPHLQERMKWALQAAEAVAYIHTKRVIHCDISLGNLLLDNDFNVRLSDFQGRLLYPDGTICLDGESGEGAKSSMPRSDPNDANQKTDLFALGSALYFMLKGHPPFPELDSWRDRREIESRFETKQFPALDDVRGGDVISKCWAGEYESADEVVCDLEKMTMV